MEKIKRRRLSAKKCKQDCFAYAKEKDECTALKFVLCKREKCPFYKKRKDK